MISVLPHRDMKSFTFISMISVLFSKISMISVTIQGCADYELRSHMAHRPPPNTSIRGVKWAPLRSYGPPSALVIGGKLGPFRPIEAHWDQVIWYIWYDDMICLFSQYNIHNIKYRTLGFNSIIIYNHVNSNIVS